MSLTAYPTLRLKLTQPQALKLRFLPAVPGSNAAAAEAAAEAAAAIAVAAAQAAISDVVVQLTDGAVIPVDASLAKSFSLVATADRALLAPTNPPATGLTQRIVIAFKASGGARQLTLPTGVAGSYRFGTTIPSLSVTVSGTTDYIGLLWNGADERWDVASYSKGF